MNLFLQLKASSCSIIIKTGFFYDPNLLFKGELFYLRSLLYHYPSHPPQNLRFVNGVLYNSFQEAAIKAGIFNDTTEAETCQLEAINLNYSPYHLRFLFCQLIVDIPSPALQLWNKYIASLSVDYMRQFRDPIAAQDRALRDIQSILQARSSNLRAMSLPEPHNMPAEVDRILASFTGRHQHLQIQAKTMMSQMNEDQFAAFTTVYDAVRSPQPPHTIFYLDGKEGRGKSFVAAALCHIVRSSSNIAIVAGSSALSVTGYERGLTAHSIFASLYPRYGFKLPNSSSHIIS